jgi:hypothetical protein
MLEDGPLNALIQAVSEGLRSSRAERLTHGQPPLFDVQDLTIEVTSLNRCSDQVLRGKAPAHVCGRF